MNELLNVDDLNKEIKNIIKECLDENTCSRKEIINTVNQKLHDGEGVTSSRVTGIISTMKENGEIEVVCKGIYRKGSSDNNIKIRNRLKSIMSKYKCDLNKACTVNLLQLDEFDKSLFVKIQAITNEFEININSAFSEEDRIDENKKFD